MKKILFIGGNLSYNKGGAALVISAKNAIKRLLPETEFGLLSFLPRLDKEYGQLYDIKVISEGSIEDRYHLFLPLWLARLIRSMLWNFIYSTTKLDIKTLKKDPILNEYIKSDVIIEISGDGLSGDYGLIATCISLFRVYIGTLLQKPVVIYAQSIGPFRIKCPFTNRRSLILSASCKYLAKLILNKVSLITSREEITLNNLKHIGISKPLIHLTADSAFLLVPSQKELASGLLTKYGIDLNGKLIGINASQSINNLKYSSKSVEDYKSYKQIINKIIEKVVSEFGAKVILIPHVTGPNNLDDDRAICSEIFDETKYKNSVSFIDEDLRPEELKGIIGMCDLFIGSRMHANIAAISMKVPTIAIGYSHKTEGIMRAAGQGEFVYNLNEFNFDEMMAKLDDIWANRENVIDSLEHNIVILESKSLDNAILVCNILGGCKTNCFYKKCEEKIFI